MTSHELSSDPTNPDLIKAFKSFHEANDSHSYDSVRRHYHEKQTTTFQLTQKLPSTDEFLKSSLEAHWSMCPPGTKLTKIEHIPEATIRETLLLPKAEEFLHERAWYKKAIEEIEAMKVEGGEKAEGHEMEGGLGEGGVLSVKGVYAEVEVIVLGDKGTAKGNYYYTRGEDGVWKIVWQDCLASGYSDKANAKMMEKMGAGGNK